MVEADEILDQERHCNSTRFIKNARMSVTVEGCQDGALTLRITRGTLARKLQFEFRAYQLEPEESESPETIQPRSAGQFVSSARKSDSVPLGLYISYIAISKTKRLQQMIVYLKHEDEQLPRSYFFIKLHKNGNMIEFDVELNRLFASQESAKLN